MIEAPVTLSACVSLANMDFTNLKMLMAMQSEQMVTAYTHSMQTMPHSTDPDDSSLYWYPSQRGAGLDITKADGMPAKISGPRGAVMAFDWKALPSGYDGFHQMECRAPGTAAEITNLMNRQDVKLAHAQIEKLRRTNTPIAAALPMDLLSILDQARGPVQDQCQGRSSGDLFGAVVAAFAVGSLATFATMKSLSKRQINVPHNILG